MRSRERTEVDAAGWLRRLAYARPPYDPRRWLLPLADRLDVAAGLPRDGLAPGRRWLVARHMARLARTYPWGVSSAALVPVALVAGCRRGR